MDEGFHRKQSAGNRSYGQLIEQGRKTFTVSQQLIQHVSRIATRLGIATAYHVYYETRGKALITLNNRLGTGISYDTLQRQLTSQCATIMQHSSEHVSQSSSAGM